MNVLIVNLQYLALMLPQNGWHLWNYIDGHLYLLKQFAQATLIIPYGFESSIDFGPFALAMVIMLLISFIAIIAIFVTFGIFDNLNPKDHYSLRKFIFHFIQICTTTLQLPILFLFFAMIIIGQTKINQHDTIINLKSILGLFGVLIFSIVVFLYHYFLRAYTFVPFYNFQQKFNLLQIVHYFFNILNAILYIIADDILIEYVKIAVLFLYFISRLTELYYFRPFLPHINGLLFMSNSSLLAILIVISINILMADKHILHEDQLLYTLLIFGSLSFYFSSMYYETKFLSTFDFEMNSFSCIYYTQEMHFKYQQTIENQKQKEFFQLYLYWKAHKVVCTRHWIKESYKTDYNQIQRTHQTIFCILNTELEKAQMDQRVSYEELLLVYISYVALFCKKPLMAYTELKRYQSQKSIQSYYFICIRYQMSIYLQELIKIQQQENISMSQGGKQLQPERQLSIHEVFETMRFQDQFIPSLIEILSDKINFWTKQLKGFNSIYEVEKLALAQSQKIHKLSYQIKKYCSFDINNLDHLQINNNVQNLKLLSIFCSSIMNDYYSSQICETAITDVYNIEHTLQEEAITNLAFIQEKAVLIMISLVKNRGKIINKDKKLILQFFGYQESEIFEIDNVSRLMPSFFAEQHDKLLLNYLQTARSSFFSTFNQVFGQRKEGSLNSYQLKLDNNFNELDDYVLIGCLSEFKKTSDYILFNEDGYLIGMTDNFFYTIINSDDQDFQIPKENVGQLNIFLIIYNMMDLLNEFKSNYGKDVMYNQQEKYLKIWKYANNKDLLENSQKIQYYSTKLNSCFNENSLLKSRTSNITVERERAEIQIYQQLGKSNVEQKKYKGSQLLQSLTIYNVQLGNQLQHVLQTLEFKNRTHFTGKASITYKLVGKKSSRKCYFVLEINDLKKADDLLKTNESLINNQYTTSIQTTNKLFYTPDLNQSNFEIIKVDKEEVTPNISKPAQPFFQRLINKYELKQQQQYVDILGMESARDSVSYGPLSQRINFISPSSKQQQMQELIEKDFTDLQNQLEYINQDINQENDVPDSSQIKSNSKDQNQKGPNIIEIYQNNKFNQKMEDIDRDAKKSKSSITSGTSGVSAITTIKQFQQNTQMTDSLKKLAIINILIMVIIIGYIIAHLVKLNTYTEQTQQTLANINGPTLFNRYFFKIFTYTWSLVFNTLEIIESSDFIIKSTISEMQDLAQIVFIDLSKMYKIFIGIEESGMLSYINLDMLYQSNENVTYTYFINLISTVSDQLFEALNYDVTTLIQIIDRRYLDNLLMLRYNLKNVVLMNSQLIDSLNEVYFQQQDDNIQEFQTQIILEIVFLLVIIVSQLIYWKQIEQYCQQILILAGRLQYTQAQEMILRFTLVIETLKQFSGNQSWKKQNFYKLLFFPLNEIGIDTVQSQSRILKDYQSSQVSQQFRIKQAFEERQKNLKKNFNVVLNSKINNPNTTIFKATILTMITFLIFLIYLLGGFVLFRQQQNDLLPTQQLTLSFIRFTSQLDIVVSTSLITKSQPLLYDKLIEMKIYTTKEIDKFRDQRKIIKIFISLYSIYYENITSIYENIIKSNKISSEDASTLLTLYQGDFCLEIGSDVPFCNYDTITNFNSLYGIPDSQDDNREYLSKGIQGIVSKLDTFFKQNYQFEINNTEYFPDKNVTKEIMISKEFTNAVMEHFLDTTDGTNLFLDTLMQAINKITNDNLNLSYTYYLITGFLLLIIFLTFYGLWIYNSNQRLILLRLILTNLPIEVLTEQHTLTLLRKLQ
ncbi:unnamed protein product (macronuclear) [Paramecium tetraurelia]|uniref:PAS domain-containing protein n=1 Tax=Paramecium tetraurelia TaxID=5888 RepID=A0CE59_PARTE|nr:uncharacterized protein GSPATT00037512001 [Paramecium tetraurelia]CAK69076.1 unnamed protein product [Paramecium tetraurelia]|eukprot:XP_001436473.1 hypothetical protein (macronuclear) [Paramecium tetraurelia strain d4-2]